MNAKTVPGKPRVFSVCSFFNISARRTLLCTGNYKTTQAANTKEKTNFQGAITIVLGLVMEIMNGRHGF